MSPSNYTLRYSVILFSVVLLACAEEQQFVTLAESLTVPAGQIIELRAPEPLRTPAYSGAGDVCLELSGSYRQADESFAILTPNNRLVRPTAEIVRSDGQVDILRQLHYLGPAGVCLSAGEPGKLRPPYVSVRLRSSEALHLERVTWMSTDK